VDRQRYGRRVPDWTAGAGAAAAALAQRTGAPRHDAVVVLGSGWGPAAAAFGVPVAEVPVADLPGFHAPVAPDHAGTVRSYAVEGLRVLVFLGRTHLYEGLGPGPVAHAVRTAAAAGARIGVLTNASGTLRPDWAPGTAVLLEDHLNLTGVSPLTGPRFVDLTDCWSARLRGLARRLDPSLAQGVYAQLPGPHVQTPAETRMLRVLGADLVGMSTAVEAVAARAAGLVLLGVSAVTAVEGTGEALDPAAVVALGRATAGRISDVLRTMIVLALR
jgi:purine-nucleoside phosphorylase